MNACGIIAEFDPLHNGHLYLLHEMNKHADCIVVLMSGHATQRGEIARFDKWARAAAALNCGADVVLELPAAFSASSAERFATASIFILSHLSGVESIGFGSESGDITRLTETAKKCLKVDSSPDMRNLIKEGYSYPRARQELIGHGELLSRPNNLLGIEYIKAALRQKSSLKFFTVKRESSQHGGNESSSSLRLYPEKIPQFVPKDTACLYTKMSRFELLERLILYRIRSMGTDDFKQLPDVTEGLENRLYRYSRTANSSEEFLSLVKNKRYTYSRLRRILLYALLDVCKEDLNQNPPYSRILGFTQKGREFLSNNSKNEDIFISPDFSALNKKFPRLCELDRRATELFSVSTDTVLPSGRDFTEKPIILSK